jgi:hypothetical protein
MNDDTPRPPIAACSGPVERSPEKNRGGGRDYPPAAGPGGARPKPAWNRPMVRMISIERVESGRVRTNFLPEAPNYQPIYQS